VHGSRPGLYLAETLAHADVVAVCEGELDALLLWQCLQSQPDLQDVGVVTPGSQTTNPRAEWLESLAGRRVLLMFDQDDAGQRGALRWKSQLPDAHIVRWPDAKDLTDYHLRGGSLPDLIRSQAELGDGV
jgi:DNA primase